MKIRPNLLFLLALLCMTLGLHPLLVAQDNPETQKVDKQPETQKAKEQPETQKAPEEGSEKLDAAALIHQFEDSMRGTTSYFVMVMTVKTSSWERTFKIESWDKYPDHSLIRILEPQKERGTGTLKIKEKLWNYMPNIDKVMKIPESMMMGSWMGSDFTNDDLAHSSSIQRDYTAEHVGDIEVDGDTVHRIVLTPKEDAPIVWEKMEIHIRKKDHAGLKQMYFNEDDELVREMIFSDHEVLPKNRILPKLWVMKSLNKKGNVTIIKLEKIKFDIPIKKGTFSLRNLKKGRQ